MAYDKDLQLDYTELGKALAKEIHAKITALKDVPVYLERQAQAPKLPAIFIDPVDMGEEYNTSGRRVMVTSMQLMVSLDPDTPKLRQTLTELAVELVGKIEYLPWNGLRIHLWDKSWTIVGTSDLAVSFTARHHHIIEWKD